MSKKAALATAITITITGCAGGPTQTATPARVIWPDVVLQLHGSGRAYIVDTKTDAVVADLETCKGGTLGSSTPDGKKVYVSCAGEGEKDVIVISLDGKKVTKRITTGNRPKHGIVSPDGRLVGVNHWGLDGGKLHMSFIDTATDNVVKEVSLNVHDPVATQVASMHNAWSLDSRYLFTVDRVDNDFVLVDTRNWAVRERMVSSAPHYPVPSPDGKELWLVLEGGQPGILVYDLTEAGMPVKDRLDLPLKGQKAVEAHHGNFTQDGKYFLVLNRGPGKDLIGTEVAVFDAKTRQLVGRLDTKSTGIGHAYNTPDGKLAVITNYGNNMISVMDVESRKIVKDLEIGTGRMGHVAFTKDGRFGYVSNDKDGALYKLDMQKLEVVKKIETAGKPGGGQVLNVWTNVFEELPR
jgi:DNA-binding beta-propeller fold protein YncE